MRKSVVRATPALFALALTAAAALVLSGCNTVEGAGKDVEAAGEAVQDAAD